MGLSGLTRTIVRVNWNQSYTNRPETLPQLTDPAWYDYRWDLWKRYTEPSLLRQTYGDFDVWLICDKELANFTRFMDRSLPDRRFKVVYDRNAAARELIGDRFIFARLDNDDMYCDTALQEFNDCETESEYIQFADGWAYDHETGRLFEWVNPSPAFLCKVGGPNMCERRFPYMLPHGQVAEVAHMIRGHKFVVVVHGNNVCNNVRGRFIGKEVEGSEKQGVLREYHITEG